MGELAAEIVEAANQSSCDRPDLLEVAKTIVAAPAPPPKSHGPSWPWSRKRRRKRPPSQRVTGDHPKSAGGGKAVWLAATACGGKFACALMRATVAAQDRHFEPGET